MSDDTADLRDKYSAEIVKMATRIHESLLYLTNDFIKDMGGDKAASFEIHIYQFLLSYYKNRDFFYEVLLKLEKEYAEQLHDKIKEKAKKEGIIN